MDPSKQHLASDDLPPPYSVTSNESLSRPHNEVTPQTTGSLIVSHLSNLRARLRSQRLDQSSIRDRQDTELLSIIIPHVEDLIASIGDLHPPPALVEAFVIPERAVGEEWRLVEKDDKLKGEVRKIVRVERHLKLQGDRKGPGKQTSQAAVASTDRGFDEWGWWDDGGSSVPAENELWWADEAMAMRLAKFLQPEGPTPRVDRQGIKAAMVQKKEEKKANRWSLFKKPDAPKPSSPTDVSALTSTPTADGEDEVTMTARAEEVAFRRENEMGLWESKAGYGIVLKIRIRQ